MDCLFNVVSLYYTLSILILILILYKKKSNPSFMREIQFLKQCVIPQDKTKTPHYDHCPHSTMSSKNLIKEFQ